MFSVGKRRSGSRDGGSETVRSAEAEPIQHRALKGSAISAVNFAFNFLLNILQVWVLLSLWPQEKYGLWLSVVAASTLLTALDGGHLTYVGNKMAGEWVVDRNAVHKTLGSAVRIVVVTGAIQLAITAWLSISGKIYEVLSVNPANSSGFAAAVLIYTAGWIALGSLASVVVRLMPVGGYYVRGTLWGIASRVVQFLALVVAAAAGWSLPWVGLFYWAVAGLVGIAFYWDIWRLFPDLTPWWKAGSLRIGFANLVKSTVFAATGILESFSNQGVVLFVTGTMGAGVVPLLTTLRTVANTVMQGSSFLLQPISPDLVRYHVRKEPEKLVAAFQSYWLLTGVVIYGGLLLGLVLVEPIYAFWTRGKLQFDPVLMAWLGASVVFRSWGGAFNTFLSLFNWSRIVLALSASRAIVTLVGCALLLPGLGLIGIGIALTAAELIAAVLLPAFIVRREFGGMGAPWPQDGFLLGGVSVLGVVGALVVYGRWPSAYPIALLLALAIIVAVAFRQWALLPDDVKLRALRLVPARIGLTTTKGSD